MKPLSECRLYAFVDTGYLLGRWPTVVAQELCDGGADIIQLRAKQSSVDEVRAMAETILSVTRRAGVPLVINDYPTVALATGAGWCHLGQEDFFDTGYTHVTQLRPHEVPLGIGLSTHDSTQAGRAMAAGADYVAVGPVFATGTKPKARPVTLDYVRWAAANVSVPWFAIGGITLENLEDVLAAGASRVCAISAILQAPSPAKACEGFKKRLLSWRPSSSAAGSKQHRPNQ